MIRQRLFKFLNKSLQIFSRSQRLAFLLLIIFIVVSYSTSPRKETLGKQASVIESQAKIEQKTTTPLTPTPRASLSNMKISGEVTDKKIAPTSTPVPKETPQNSVAAVSNSSSINTTDSSDLLSSINSFRAGNGGIAPLTTSGTLCDIAGKRLSELITIRTLDNHAGFNKYFQEQKEFSGMGEVLFQSSNSTSPDYAVNEGWAKSKDGHRENMLNPSWNYGCGATNSHIAVFNFGKK
mgnify:CR=1 FL=1